MLWKLQQNKTKERNSALSYETNARKVTDRPVRIFMSSNRVHAMGLKKAEN